MGMLVRQSRLSTFYLDAKDIFDPESRSKQIIRLIARCRPWRRRHRFSVACRSSTRTTRSTSLELPVMM